MRPIPPTRFTSVARGRSRACTLALLLPLTAALSACVNLPPPRVMTDAEKTSSATLAVGDPAPALVASQWLSGDPVPRFEPGTVYVLDFWASWCGPCLASMPRTSRLQNRHAGKVVVIGVTTLDEDNTPRSIRNTMAELHVSFRVAIDDGQATAERYPIAMRDTAIPRSYVIDQRGRLAWQGHPSDVAPVVDAVLVGTWNLDEAAREGRRREEARLRSQIIVAEYLAACDTSDREGQLRATERACEIPVKYMSGMSPDSWAWFTRVSLLAAAGRTEDAKSVARQATATPEVSDDPHALAQIASALHTVALDDAATCADLAMQRLVALESRTPADEWDQYIAQGELLRMAYVRYLVADIRAAQGRFAEAADLLHAAIARWPDDRRYIPNKNELKKRYEDYKARANVAKGT